MMSTCIIYTILRALQRTPTYFILIQTMQTVSIFKCRYIYVYLSFLISIIIFARNTDRATVHKVEFYFLLWNAVQLFCAQEPQSVSQL